MTILIRWYDRKLNFMPDYEKEHYGRIAGVSADDCWKTFVELGQNHDLVKYTRREIIGMYD